MPTRVFRCSYQSSKSGIQIVNTFHVIAQPATEVGTQASADSVRDALHTALTTKYKALLTNQATLLSLMVREETAPGSGAIPEESLQSINAAGTYSPSNSNLPMSVTMLAKISTNAAVRSGHGRIFFPSPQSSGTLGSGVWALGADGYYLAVKAWLDEYMLNHALLTPFTDFSVKPVVYSRTRRARGDANYYFGVTGYSIRPEPHWLRSRATAP